jgi:hypothetical protein
LIINLRNSTAIQKTAAAFLLLLFSFCVTPKRVLHDLLANHRDAQTSGQLSAQQIAASGFHCHIDDLVVMAPFLPGIQSTVIGLNSSTPWYFNQTSVSVSFGSLSIPDGRGPPAHFII